MKSAKNEAQRWGKRERHTQRQRVNKYLKWQKWIWLKLERVNLSFLLSIIVKILTNIFVILLKHDN